MNNPTKILNWKSANSQQALVKAAVFNVSKWARVDLFLNRFYMFKVNLFVDGAGRGSIKEADSGSQWFLSLSSVAYSQEKPLLTGYCICQVT